MLLIDRELPESCNDCPCINDEDAGQYCNLYPEIETNHKERPDNCPLIYTPHSIHTLKEAFDKGYDAGWSSGYAYGDEDHFGPSDL